MKLICTPSLHNVLTHWGRMTHICTDNLTIIGSDNGLSPAWRQAIIWTNAGILLIGPSGINFSEIVIAIHIVPLNKMHLKMLSTKWRPFCLGLNVLWTKICDKKITLFWDYITCNKCKNKMIMTLWMTFVVVNILLLIKYILLKRRYSRVPL